MEINTIPIPFYEKLISDVDAISYCEKLISDDGEISLSEKLIPDNEKEKIINKIDDGTYAEIYKISFKENPFNQNINGTQPKESTFIMKKIVKILGIEYVFREFGFQNSLLHPFIIDLFACSLYHTKDDRVKFSPLIAMPYADLGTLSKITVETKFKDWDKTDIYKLIYSICRSIWFLHSENICHRDIKPNNILIMKDKTVKISDFGLTKIKNETKNSIVFKPRPYYAPESLTFYSSYPADVFSLSLCLYEIFEKKSVAAYFVSKDKPYLYRSDDNRPAFTNKTPINWQNLIKSMWCTKADDRLTMDSIIKEIEKEEYFIEGSNAEEIRRFIENTKQKENEMYYTNINEDAKYLIETEDKEENTKNRFKFISPVNSAIDNFTHDLYKINHTKPNVEKNAKKGRKGKPRNEQINKQNQINRSYNKMIRNFMKSNDADTLLSIASYYIFQLNDYTSAYIFLKKHRKSENKDVQNLIQLMFLESEKSSFVKAMLFEAEEKYEEAIDLYSEYLEEGQINLNAVGRLGRILFILGEDENTREEGFQLMENAASLCDKFSMFHLGVYYYQKGSNSTPKNKEDIKKSIKYFEKIKDFPDVEMMLYLCYSVLEDMDKEGKYRNYVNQIYYNYD